jgi:hypothetical protein
VDCSVVLAGRYFRDVVMPLQEAWKLAREVHTQYGPVRGGGTAPVDEALGAVRDVLEQVCDSLRLEGARLTPAETTAREVLARFEDVQGSDHALAGEALVAVRTGLRRVLREYLGDGRQAGLLEQATAPPSKSELVFRVQTGRDEEEWPTFAEHGRAVDYARSYGLPENAVHPYSPLLPWERETGAPSPGLPEAWEAGRRALARCRAANVHSHSAMANAAAALGEALLELVAAHDAQQAGGEGA